MLAGVLAGRMNLRIGFRFLLLFEVGFVVLQIGGVKLAIALSTKAAI